MRPRNKALFTQFVRSRARGETIASFCKRTKCSEGTAEKWSASPELKEQVDAIHQALDERFIARNVHRLDKAQSNIHTLGDVGTAADAVKLRANERVLDDRLNVRLRKIERDLDAMRRRKGGRDAKLPSNRT